MYNSYFDNKIIWITGASSGIGEALAVSLAKCNARLILSSRRESELLRVKDLCEQSGSKVKILVLDLLKSDELVQKSKEAISLYGKIDIFINNGGVTQRSLIVETPIEVDRKIMEVDYFGGVIITKAILPTMIENKYGHIVSISSISGCFGFPLRSAYCAAKHAMYGFFETVHAELSDKNIFSTIIAPGRINTTISTNAITKDGTAYGKMDHGQAGGMDVTVFAHKTLKAISKKKVEAVIGGKEIIMVFLRRKFSFVFFRIVKKVNPI
ncbi:MAG: SDR family NAD(P)-dependent oxidoreductase [Bacteroidales bacterium]|nr:SDR family NAD(P)-dependent oxidoreductase [Bacteroidales bacterium]